ncbi:putative FAD-binding PCMH-type domain-containing protein [Seiridium unicorne]|uniref:FAD-binding PCMH-type domain-containing protein n=1 Tax=Seiridium unicorne TaxID=138068 RepID=A0ABR2V0D4_9PEZI
MDQVHPKEDGFNMMGCTSLGNFCCLGLTSLLGDSKVAGPGSAIYSASLESYFSAQQASINPACIVSPQSTEDVAATVKWLVTNGRNCTFAVRSGGHTGWAGASNVADGVVIDLRALDAVEPNTENSTVSVGVGATWDAVYAKLDPLNMSVNGGRAAGVGVGGLTLGGGISFFSPRYGWTCDTVSNFQVVLADGSTVDANKTSNPDLFRALKGGNNNFGVVTRMELAIFKQGPLWASTIYQLMSTKDDVIREFVKANSRDSYDEYASFYTTFVYTQARGISVIANELEYTKEIDSPAIYEGFLSLPNIQNNTRVTNMTALSVETAAVRPVDQRSLSRVVTIASTEASIKAAFDRWNATVADVSQVSNIIWAFVLEPLPPAIYARAAEGNSLGLENRTEPLIVALLSATWTNATDDLVVTKAAKAFFDAVDADGRQSGTYDPYIYLDYADQDQQVIASYGSESVRRLRQVQRRVDPLGVFTVQVPGGYKIPTGEEAASV